MNPSYRVANLRLGTVLALLAALVMLVVATAPAGGASSGGVSATGDETKTEKYKRLWREYSRKNRRWANRTAKCESGKDPKAIGGGGRYRGAFQFMKSTWRAAPKSPGGDPIKHPYKTQGVVAIALKKRDGKGHWPNCG